ncbi:MAG: DUF308 domain-containing protein [Clostridia bacterium]|nr:DUF308 domain-containing protein [Clostridia bacterium]
MEKKFEKKDVKNVVVAAVLLVVGILFCFSSAMGNKALSWIIGSALILTGVLSVINSFSIKKSTLTSDGIIGAAIAAFGILFAGNTLSWIIFNYIPFLLICTGIVITIDAFIKKIKDKETSKFVFELILGVLTIALGFCLKYVNGFSEFTSVILGIVLIVYAIYSIISIFLKNKEDEKKKEDKE